MLDLDISEAEADAPHHREGVSAVPIQGGVCQEEEHWEVHSK